MSNSPLQPPAPFADFEFTFDPSLSNLFPNPPPLPSSADLFSPSETTDLLGFLDNFGDIHWDLNNDDLISYDYTSNTHTPYSNPHLNTAPEPSTSIRPKSGTRSASSRGSLQYSAIQDVKKVEFDATTASQSATTSSVPQTNTASTYVANSAPESAAGANPRAKPLLTTPQKRLNHIMSEQKRRNAIRDGYAQLISLLAPAGSAPGIGMPTRGRPKGSGSRGRGQTKGKSGVLFRAVEYCRWLEEGKDALLDEVLRVEAAAGIRHQGP
ncbi:hypothetical protein BDQ17DRAFT_1298500 [Cyathus striatus]|nr:hypothetical protein BDQ17DRAFT_1298500 [Cyathus striatus]